MLAMASNNLMLLLQLLVIFLNFVGCGDAAGDDENDAAVVVVDVAVDDDDAVVGVLKYLQHVVMVVFYILFHYLLNASPVLVAFEKAMEMVVLAQDLVEKD